MFLQRCHRRFLLVCPEHSQHLQTKHAQLLLHISAIFLLQRHPLLRSLWLPVLLQRFLPLVCVFESKMRSVKVLDSPSEPLPAGWLYEISIVSPRQNCLTIHFCRSLSLSSPSSWSSMRLSVARSTWARDRSRAETSLSLRMNGGGQLSRSNTLVLFGTSGVSLLVGLLRRPSPELGTEKSLHRQTKLCSFNGISRSGLRPLPRAPRCDRHTCRGCVLIHVTPVCG